MPYTDKAEKTKRQRERREAKKRAGMAPLPLPAVPGKLAGEVIGDWAEATLKVPSGPLRGQPFRIPTWQRCWISGAMAQGVREAGLSCARKNGKSGLIAAVVLAHLCGPFHRPDWRAVVVSLTGALAAELRDAIEKTAEISGLSLTVYRSPLPGHIIGPGGTRVNILASDKATGHAIGADLAIIDEGGLIQEAGRDLWGAVYSSISGRDGRLMVISIRGDGPMFSELSERAAEGEVFWQEYAAAEDCALEDVGAWEAANPGLADGIKSLAYMRDAAARAGASPSDARLFRAHDLNQPGQPSQQPLVEVAHWLACESEELPDRAGWVVLGIDCGGSSSMTAACALWESGRLEAWGAFPDTPGLIERGRADGVGGRYAGMVERGELLTYPGRTTPVADFLATVAADLGQRPKSVAADYYRINEIKDWLGTAGLGNWPMDWRRMGTGPNGAEDVRAFQRLVLDRQVATRPSLMFRAALADSVVRYDANGNQALDKKRQRGRIDVLSAAVLAAGLWERQKAAPPRRGYLGMIQ